MEDLRNRSSSTGPWPTVRIGDVLRLVNGRAFKTSEWSKSGVPIIRIQNLNDVDAPFNYFVGDLPAKFAVKDGDLLFAWSGTPGTSFGAHVWSRGRAWLNQHIFKVEFDRTQFDCNFLRLAINQNLNEYIRAAHGAAGLAHITKAKFNESRLPCPSMEEQLDVVARVERALTQVEAGWSSLRRSQVSLLRYRTSTLRAACEGRLVPTEAELARRSVRPSESEMGDALLGRLLEARRQKNLGRRSTKEVTPADVDDLPRLPEGWVWATIDQISDVVGGVTVDQKRKPAGAARRVPYLRVANVQRGYLDLSEVKEILVTEAEIRELCLQPGDILFNEGGDRDKLGRGWIWNGELPECIHQNHVFRARLHDPRMSPKFVSWYANTFGQRFFFEEGKHTTNLASISMSKLKRLPVPVPPLEEQARVVTEVERRLSVIVEVGAEVEANLRRAAVLRQAVLQRAFSGDRRAAVARQLV